MFFYDIVFLSINMEFSISSLFANLGHQRFTIFCIDLSIYFVIFTLSHFHVSFIFKIIITSFSFPPPNPPIYPSLLFSKFMTSFSLIVVTMYVYKYMFLKKKLLNLNAYMYVLRVDHLVLDSQLVFSSLGKTIFLLMSIDSIITIRQQSHPQNFIDYFVT